MLSIKLINICNEACMKHTVCTDKFNREFDKKFDIKFNKAFNRKFDKAFNKASNKKFDIKS